MAVVLDEHGGTAGVITLEDLFEEVAGEIPEGTERPQLYRDAAGLLHAAGTVRIEEVGEALGIVLEHEEVDSVSGLVMTLLGRSPRSATRSNTITCGSKWSRSSVTPCGNAS